MATRVKAPLNHEFDFEKIEEGFLKQINTLNAECMSLCGNTYNEVVPLSERGTITEMVKLEYLEDLKSVCSSLKSEISSIRLDISTRAKELDAYLKNI